MKATEARSIAEQKAPTLEQTLDMIKNQCQYGNNSIYLIGQIITPELMQGLLQLGYIIREHTYPINGMKGLNVSW